MPPDRSAQRVWPTATPRTTLLRQIVIGHAGPSSSSAEWPSIVIAFFWIVGSCLVPRNGGSLSFALNGLTLSHDSSFCELASTFLKQELNQVNNSAKTTADLDTATLWQLCTEK
jgi:hypothetical protein